MLFSSIPFLYYYLPVVLLLYFIVPKRVKNLILLLASLFFYAWGEPAYVVLMVISILAGYLFGLLMERSAGTKLAKLWLVLSCVLSLSALGYFKYADFFIENVNALTGFSIPMLRIALPIGISFYTFQILSYDIDVYRGNVPAQRNIIKFATYVSLFPQLIAGPIVRYVDIEKQLSERSSSVEGIYVGIRRFVYGLAKKVLLANSFGALCDTFHNASGTSVLFTWMYAIAFTLQIYFDFSGYSDMAIGLSKIFGFDFPENFNYPYISKTVTEFWRRWHISLGSWFRDYVYIPLGGNRVSTVKWLRNILVVWMLTGFWHGASWNFILWGLFFAVLLMLEKFLIKKPSKTGEDIAVPSTGARILHGFGAVFRHIYVLLAVVLSFVLFNASSIGAGFREIGGLFGFGGLAATDTEALYYLASYAVTFLIGFVACTPAMKLLVKKLGEKSVLAGGVIRILEPIFLAALLMLVTANLVDGSFNPFLYFRF